MAAKMTIPFCPGDCFVIRERIDFHFQRTTGIRDEIPASGCVSARRDGVTAAAAAFQEFARTMTYTCEETFMESRV